MPGSINSHYFRIIGDKLINPIVGVYIPIIRIPIKGGMTIPNIRSFDHGTYVDGSEIWRSPPFGMKNTLVNTGINYQPQLVIAGFLPSTVRRHNKKIILKSSPRVDCSPDSRKKHLLKGVQEFQAVLGVTYR